MGCLLRSAANEEARMCMIPLLNCIDISMLVELDEACVFTTIIIAINVWESGSGHDKKFFQWCSLIVFLIQRSLIYMGHLSYLHRRKGFCLLQVKNNLDGKKASYTAPLHSQTADRPEEGPGENRGPPSLVKDNGGTDTFNSVCCGCVPRSHQQ